MSDGIDIVVALTLRASLALLFATAALHKLHDMPRFVQTLRDYRLLPQALIAPAATVFPAAEGFVAAGIASGLAVAAGATAAIGLLLAYAGAIAVNVAAGRTQIDCGCTGPAAHIPVSGALIVRNVVVALATTLLLAPLRDRPLDWLDIFTVAAGVATAAACWMAVERMLAVAPALARLRTT